MGRFFIILVLTLFLPITQLLGQDGGNVDRDAAIKEAIEAQKRAAIEEGRAREQATPSDNQAQSPEGNRSVSRQYYYRSDSINTEEWERIQREWEAFSRSSQDALESYWETFNQAIDNTLKEHADGHSSGSNGYYNPYVMPNGGNFMFYGDPERTTLDLSKTMIEDTFSTTTVFDVDRETSTFIISISGDCRAGTIAIKVIMPDGKVYADLLIDEFGNLNWRKIFSISETENVDKVGTWKFQIDSTGASGHFKISAQTF